MGNEDRKTLMENVTSMPRDYEKKVEINGGAGEKGIKVVRVAQWKTKCESYFNRHFKTSSVSVVPSVGDIIMNTLRSVCSENKGRGFVFKNYDIAKHLEFLGYNKKSLDANLGVPLMRKSISYIAYTEQRNTVFIFEKVLNSSSVDQLRKNISVMIKYFLTLYNTEIQASGVKIIGILIREKEQQGELPKCSFCDLFSASYKDFETPTTFKVWLNAIETYEGWWDLSNCKNQNNLFYNLAADILCFMALQEKSLPTVTDGKSQQFKQTYLLYTPQQMDIHFSDAKHVVIQGSYGSGKSILGIKKLELISKGLGPNEKIIYINFDHNSDLHFLMEKNLKEYAGISSRKIKHTKSIGDILKSPSRLIYLCHNSTGESLSAILQETVRLSMSTKKMVKTNFHLIIEEFDGETLSHNEAAKITKLVKGDNLKKSHIILLAQPLMKKRSLKIGKESYEKETCMFHELENTFKILKLEKVLRCSNEISAITKSTQNYVQNKDSVFTTEMDEFTLGQRQRSESNQKLQIGTSPNFETSRNEKISNTSNDFSKINKSLDRGIDLDEAFERSAPLQKSNATKNKIVSKFGFICEPSQGVDIEGLKPNLVKFSEGINLTSDIAVISLALVLKGFIGKNKKTTFLYMTEEQPGILRRTFQLLLRLDENFSYTQDIRKYLQKNKQSKMIFSSNFRCVNGMEFDHVVIVVTQTEYYLKYYLPQVISRCTYDLNFVLLPKDKNDKTKETVANMIEELNHECLVRQTVITDCKECEKSWSCYSISKEADNKQTFKMHTHSDQYKDYSSHLKNYKQSESDGTGNSALAKAK